MAEAEETEVKVKKLKSKQAFVEPENEEESEEEGEEDDEFEFDMEDMNLGSILQNFLVGEDGTNVCETLNGIKKSIDTQNKILMKVVTLLSTK